MAKRKVTKNYNTFGESLLDNSVTFMNYYERLLELSISMFEWQNLPETMDERFLERCLFERGNVLLYLDKELGEFLSLPCLISGQLDVYNIPKDRIAYANNGYRYQADKYNSVICFNNMLLGTCKTDILEYAKRLYEIDRTIDINVKAQKTPVLISCSEEERLSMLNLYQKYDGNAPVIFGDSSLMDNSLKVLSTQAPFLADKLFSLKQNIWNEALTYLGIPNINMQKKERLITDEVNRGMGGTLASRNSRLLMRQKACNEFNNMYNMNIWVEYRDEVVKSVIDDTTEEGEIGE